MKSIASILPLFFLFLLATNLPAQTQQKPVAKVKQVTPDLVFLDLLQADSLSKDDRIQVRRKGTLVATLIVQFASSGSASCRPEDGAGEIQVGDFVFLHQKNIKDEAPEVIAVAEPAKKELKPEETARPKTRRTSRPDKENRIRGRLSVQWYQWIDSSDSDSGFIQPALRIKLRGEHLAGNDYEFHFKTRTRYTDRDRPFTSGLEQSEWQNRIYQASFGRTQRERPIGFMFGRLLNRVLPNIGPIDGGLFQWNPNKANQFGIFAGLKPEWQYGTPQSNHQKYGLYYNHIRGSYDSLYWTTTLALNTETKDSEVSRDYAYYANRIHWRRKVHFYQSLELDFMRDWRKDHSDSSSELTSFYSYLNVVLSDTVTAGLSYDNRKNTPTLEYRTLDEAYFDDLYRQGLRLNLYVKLWAKSRLSMNFGKRTEEDGIEPGSDSQSYMVSYYQPGIFRRFSLALRYYGYENPTSDGSNPSIRIGWHSQKGHSFQLSFHQSSYTSISTQQERDYEWIGLQAYGYFTRSFYGSLQYEYRTEDQLEGHKVFLELGYRFR